MFWVLEGSFMWCFKGCFECVVRGVLRGVLRGVRYARDVMDVIAIDIFNFLFLY